MNFDRYRLYTQARIGLGRAGAALSTKDWLLFSLHHAAAVDAIMIPWDLSQQENELLADGVKAELLSTRVTDRREYLLRPDLGRKLSEESKNKLHTFKQANESILIIASNGLSSLAVKNHLAPFLRSIFAEFKEANLPVYLDTIFLLPNGRVALIDDLGEILKPALGITIIGERPGLSAPDSLAAYLTYRPTLGLSDAERNCISNIRPPHGLSYEEAAFKLTYLVKEALRRKLSGVLLKDDAPTPDSRSLT